MIRFAAAALCLTVASPALADDLVGFYHTHHDGYTGSFSNPINYRPGRAEGLTVVRTKGYTEEPTLIIKRGRAGVTTGTTIVPPQSVTGSTSGAPLVMLGENLPES